jgi:hypothetical protein
MITLPGLDRAGAVRHGFFTREGGVSGGLYASRNCGFGAADPRDNVARNRARCVAELSAGPCALVTGYQTHSAAVATVEAPWPPEAAPEVDALVTRRPGIALGILTADCAPVLLADAGAGVIGAAHAGWKGALGGVLEAAVAAMAALGAEPARIAAGIGPRIGAASYEVGAELRDRVVGDSADTEVFFAPAARPGHFLFDLAGYVERRLCAAGVGLVEAAAHDTYVEEARFFSYRRATHRGEPDYGRGLSAIALPG